LGWQVPVRRSRPPSKLLEDVADAVVFLPAQSVDPTTAIGAASGGLAGTDALDRRALDMV